jgi:hypothetical protein
MLAQILGAGVFTSTPTPAPAPSGTDPLTLSPIAAWDFSRSVLAVNNDGTGGTPSVGAEVYYLADLVGTKHARRIAGAAPIRRTDATLSRDYGEWTNSGAARLQSDAFTQASPFEIFWVVRPRSGTAPAGWKADAYLGSSRDGYSAAALQKTASPSIVGFDGASQSAETDMALGAWHVVNLILDATDSLQVDNQTAVTGNFGSAGISGGYNLGNGPDTDSNRAGDYDWMACYIMPLLSSGNRAGVKTFLGARVGLNL